MDKLEEHYNSIIYAIGTENNIDVFYSGDNSPETSLKNFVDLYKPVAYTNDKINTDCDLRKYPDRNPETMDICLYNLVRHYINKKRVFKLLDDYTTKNKVEYDIIVSLRLDLMFYSSFNFTSIKPNTIYVPNGADHSINAINDQIAYGNFNSMKKYMNIFDNIIYLLENKKSIPHSESLHYANIVYNNLNIERVPLIYVIDKLIPTKY